MIMKIDISFTGDLVAIPFRFVCTKDLLSFM